MHIEVKGQLGSLFSPLSCGLWGSIELRSLGLEASALSTETSCSPALNIFYIVIYFVFTFLYAASHVWKAEDNLWESVFPLCGSWELNSSGQVWQQAPLPTKPSCQLIQPYSSVLVCPWLFKESTCLCLFRVWTFTWASCCLLSLK